jgi:hypothetical protein
VEKGDARNRLAGIAYERAIVQQINDSDLFIDVGRSAEIDKEMDAKKVDIIPIDVDLFAAFEYRIQAKTSTKHVPYAKLLKDIEDNNEDGIAVVLHKKTKRVEGDRYLTEGTYAILSQEDFFSIIEDLEKFRAGYREYAQHWDSIDEAEKPALHERLKELGI